MAVVRIEALSLLKARVQSLVGGTKNLKPGYPPPPAKKKSQKRVKDQIKGNTRGKGEGL